ncbi:AAA family ATPase [Ancylobacter sp. SL191]|uniref:AAA family ATPase n=1 Tax=Ancylobacter sp. SL191 TaxID=2995166 RepID=UPI002D1E37FC|nr:AAA family ATPase [Ancylobacter sp. SL191]
MPATVVDHIIPHRGDSKLFWSRSNWQALCVTHHSRSKQAAEKGGGDAALARAHPFLKRARIPVVIVCGAPGSGKSTYVDQHKGPNDLVIDLDVIRSRLAGSSLYGAGPQWTAPALDERNRILQGLAADHVHERAWFIVSAPEREERDLWVRKLGTARVVLMPTPLEECLRRIAADPGRAGHVDRMQQAARDWFARFERETPA